MAGNKDGLSPNELSGELDIPKGNLSALLSNLVSREYVSYNPVIKGYRLGPMILALAGRPLSDLDIAQLGQPVEHKVMVRKEESAEPAVRSGHKIQTLCKVNLGRMSLEVFRPSGNEEPRVKRRNHYDRRYL